MLFLGIGIFLVGGLVFYYSYFYEPNRILIEREVCFFSKVQGEIRILQISDLHLYSSMRRSRLDSLRRVLWEINEEALPDVVFITGDTLDKNSGLDILDEVLSQIKSKFGVYAILGNHDYFQYNLLHLFLPKMKRFGQQTDTDGLIQKYRSHRIRVLSDEAETLTLRDNVLQIIGLGMLSGKKADISESLKQPFAGLNIVLSHYPDAIQALRGKVDIVFSGHTHGGQVTFFGVPLSARCSIAKKDSRGLSMHKGTRLWVSKGVGVSHYLPFRFFAHPDVTLMTLKGKKDA